MRQPGGPLAPLVDRRNQHREDVAQPPHKIGSEPPAVRVFDEAQQAPFQDASNDASIHLAMILDLFRSRRNLCCYRRRLGRVGLWVKLQAFGSTDSKDHPVRYYTLERQLVVDRELSWTPKMRQLAKVEPCP